MVKVIRMAILLLAFHALPVAHATAKESYCRLALDRCIVQCERYPGMLADGCSLGCWLGYLNCE